MARVILFLSLLICSAVALADPAYQLDLGATSQAGRLKVEPTVTGPANKSLRYKMEIRNQGGGNARSRTGDVRLGGSVHLDADGHARIASSSVSLSSGVRYRVTVQVFDGKALVAEQSADYVGPAVQ